MQGLEVREEGFQQFPLVLKEDLGCSNWVVSLVLIPVCLLLEFFGLEPPAEVLQAVKHLANLVQGEEQARAPQPHLHEPQSLPS